MISSALERRVVMNWGHTEVFPNQYIVLIGPSGVRKGEPLTIVRSLLEEVNINLVAEAITREALIRRIKNSMTNYELPYEKGLKLRYQSAVTAVIEELATFLEGDPRFLAALTNWYDSRERWVYETKNQGIDDITGICFNMLGSMAPDWIPHTIPSSTIGGGFTSRILFIVEHRKARTIEDPNQFPIDLKMRANIIADLEDIRQLSGEIIFHPRALELYKSWYAAEDAKINSGRPPLTDPRFSGYVSRRATHVKKISMAVSAARSNSLVVTEQDFKRAKALMERAEINMQEAFEQVGLSDYAEQTTKVMKWVKERGTATRSQVMQEFYRDIDGRAMEIIQSTLVAARFIRVDLDLGQPVYTWISHG